MSRDIEQYERIVDQIYGASADPVAWLNVVGQVAGYSGGFGGALVLWDTANGYMPVTHNQAFPEDFWADYRTHHINVDPRADGFLRQPHLEVYADLMLIDAETRRKNEVMNFIRRETEQAHGYGARLFATKGYQSMLILARTETQGSAQRQDLDRLEAFVPHLRRSIAISRRLGERVSRASFEALSFGVLVLDEFGRLNFTNKAMQSIANERDGLRLSAAGLVLDDPGDDAAYRRLVDSMRRRAFFEIRNERRALQARRPSGARPYSIQVSPFPHVESVFPGFGLSVLVCVSDPAQTGQLSEELLTALFGLTPAEGRLCLALVRFGILKAAAEACRLTEDSARQYVKRILVKTGARSQVDLVALLLGSARQ
ncbi:MAG: hypothetical protein U1E60_30830 [Reyranellaceae bacterium]